MMTDWKDQPGMVESFKQMYRREPKVRRQMEIDDQNQRVLLKRAIVEIEFKEKLFQVETIFDADGRDSEIFVREFEPKDRSKEKSIRKWKGTNCHLSVEQYMIQNCGE